MNKVAEPRPPPRPAPGGVGPMTKRQLTKHQREERFRALVLCGVAAALVLVVVIPLIGYYREVLTKGSQPIAVVDGQAILLDDYAKLFGFRQASVESQIFQMQQIAAQQTGANAGANTMFAKQLQQLQQQRTDLSNSVIDEMVDQRLIAADAARRSIAVTTADEDAYITREFGTPPQPTPAASPTGDAALTPVPTPVPTVDALARLGTVLTNLKVMNENDYRSLVVRPALLDERVRAAMAADAPPTEAQVHARHILVDTEEKAKTARQRIADGEPFEKVAADMSSDAATKSQGGDLGWFGKGKMVPQFEAVAFTMQPGQISDPVRSGFGWHIIQVLERDDNRPIDEARRKAIGDQLFKDFLQKAKDDGFKSNTIVYYVTPDKLTWASNQITKARGLPRGTP